MMYKIKPKYYHMSTIKYVNTTSRGFISLPTLAGHYLSEHTTAAH